MRIGLIIASYGRPELLQQHLSSVARQVRPPDEIVLSLVCDGDRPPGVLPDLNIRVVYASQGSCAQRNKGLEFFRDRVDVVLFVDDDFWMAPIYVQELERIFSTNDDVVAATGLVLADGATGPGISIAEAEKCIDEYMSRRKPEIIKDVPDTYGCNMAFRASKIGDLRFDERLPLYGWQEDVDFSAQLRSRGRIIWANALWGVHLGTKKGKISGRRFGYSQVINPLYILRKGNMSLRRAALLIGKNMVANATKSLFPEPYIDRLGRLKGNVIGLRHALLGKLDPMHALEL
jgi:GT2 family glycosyltransferase